VGQSTHQGSVRNDAATLAGVTPVYC
jgi:hypothetical protein